MGLGNKEIMAKNIKKYINQKGVTASEVASYLGVPLSTFSYWINAKSYPRIDKIEMMANYFGIKKSDLVEEFSSYVPDFEPDHIELIEMYSKLTKEQKQTVMSMLHSFTDHM